jgi:hypothetical protein
MSPNRRGSAGGKGRYVWLGVAALLVLLIGASFALAGRARTAAEDEAQLVAEQYVASGLSSSLTAEAVDGDLRDRDYQDLLVDMQSGILSDANVLRVRIWRPDGDLVFSTAVEDDVEEFTLDSPEIQQAAEGRVVSVVAEATDAPLAGLEGNPEALFVTYVPLQFAEDSAPAAVVELDQRYSALLEELNGLWRPVQIGLGVALLGLGVLFAVWQRRSKRRESSRWSPRPTRQSDDARRLRDLEARALAAERASQLAEERLAQAEGRVTELEKAEVPPEIRTRLDELELKLRAEEAERQQAAGEAKRLRSALSEREAELALVRDRTTSTEAEKARSVDAIRRAEQQHAEAEQRAAAAGTLAAEAESRVSDARNKVMELEAALRDADRRIAEAVAQATKKATEAAIDQEARLSGELRASQLESSSLKLRLAETEEALRATEARRTEAERASEARRAEAEGVAAELVKVRAESDAGRAELQELRLALQRAELELDTAREELGASRDHLQASSAEVGAVRAELEVSRGERDRALAEIERLRGEREGATTDAHAARAEVQAARAEALAARDDAQAARAELEVSRGERDRAVHELDRVRADLDAMGERVRGLSAERSALERAVSDAEVRAEVNGEGSVAGPELATLQARVAELESHRRSDVAELQRAQESLANTQVELMESNRKLKASEERLRELEGGATAPSREATQPGKAKRAAPEPEPVARSAEGDRPAWTYETEDVASEFAGLISDEATDEQVGSEPEGPPEETLSLRERLARAAAARHRTVQPHD